MGSAAVPIMKQSPGFGTPGSNQYSPGVGGSTPSTTPGNSPVWQADSSGYGGGSPYYNPFQAYNPSYSMSSNNGYFGSSGTGTSTGSSDFQSTYSPYANPGQNYGQIDVGGGGIHTIEPLYPGLSGNWAQYLDSQVGQGISPFGQSVALPTGGSTQAGQLTAGENPLLSQLQNFFMTGQGGSMPGMSQLSNIATNGVSALPEWQAMVQAQQQNIQQNQAGLAEQFGSMGDLAGSPFGTAMSNYMQQTTADQNALLGQLTQSNIQNIQMPAIESLFGGSQQMATGLQSLDQSAINNAYSQYQTDAPQNNPLTQAIQGMSTLFPPTMKTPSTWEMINQTIGALTGSGYSSSNSDGSSSSYNF